VINKIREDFLFFSRPTIGKEEIAEVIDSLQSGWITTGPKVERFEKQFAQYLNVSDAVAVNSATAGLHLALLSLGLKPEDEVITPAMSWPSAANMTELLGARVVFVDVDRDTLQIIPEEIEKKISKNTKAIIPVHFAGAPCDLDQIKKIIASKNIALIEDAAHAVGTEYKESLIGHDCEFAIFSFHPIKNITTGEGGMVICRDKEKLEQIRLLKFHGVSKDAWKRYSKGGNFNYEVIEPGFKYNMLDLQAALGIRQLERINDFIMRRKFLADRYNQLLADIPEVTPLVAVSYNHRHAWHLYIIKLDIDRLKISRDDFMSLLQENNIGTGLHYTPIHLHRYYANKYGYRKGDLVNSEYVGERILSLPLYPLMSDYDQDCVVAAIKRIINNNKI